MPPQPSLLRAYYEAAIDVARGGRGYTQQERADFEARRALLEERLAAPELTDAESLELEGELQSVERALSPLWRSPWRDRSFEEIHTAWRGRLQLLGLLSLVAAALWFAWRVRMRAQPEPAPVAVGVPATVEPEAGMTLRGPDRHLAADLREIEIPPALAGRVKATLVQIGDKRYPAVQIDGRADRTYPLMTQVRRRYLSVLLARPSEELQHREIMEQLRATYSTCAAVWSEGKDRRLLKIVTDGVIAEGADKGRVRLNLDA